MRLKALAAAAWYGPPDWLVDKVGIRGRRAFGFWTIILAVVGALFFGHAVLYVTVLSIIALIPNFASETPVEIEGDDVDVENAENVTVNDG